MLVPSGIVAVPLPGRLANVITEKMPAAVMGDFVMCTGATSMGPAHPPMAGPPPTFLPPLPMPPIAKGSATVLINGLPAADGLVTPQVAAHFLGDPKLAVTRTVLIGG